ncbi:MAG: hypothetical protein WEE64_05075 [Dehalococcoidia bacterium]
MTKTEACKVLQVASSADEEIVTQAYWHLARKFRAEASRDKKARARLDNLNRAYLVLLPKSSGTPSPTTAMPAEAEPPLTEELAMVGRRIIQRTRARWQGRLPELAILSATTATLTYLALSAGASVPLTILAAGFAVFAFVAPWRRLPS